MPDRDDRLAESVTGQRVEEARANLAKAEKKADKVSVPLQVTSIQMALLLF